MSPIEWFCRHDVKDGCPSCRSVRQSNRIAALGSRVNVLQFALVELLAQPHSVAVQKSARVALASHEWCIYDGDARVCLICGADREPPSGNSVK